MGHLPSPCSPSKGRDEGGGESRVGEEGSQGGRRCGMSHG